MCIENNGELRLLILADKRACTLGLDQTAAHSPASRCGRRARARAPSPLQSAALRCAARSVAPERRRVREWRCATPPPRCRRVARARAALARTALRPRSAPRCARRRRLLRAVRVLSPAARAALHLPLLCVWRCQSSARHSNTPDAPASAMALSLQVWSFVSLLAPSSLLGARLNGLAFGLQIDLQGPTFAARKTKIAQHEGT